MHKIIISIGLVFFISQLYSQLDNIESKYSGCSTPLSKNDFNYVKLFGKLDMGKMDAQLREPVQMALYEDEQGKIDIYFVELRDVAKADYATGRVRVYEAEDDYVTTLLELEVSAKKNDGLSGIALDPNFRQNGWIYIQYQQGNHDTEEGYFRLSRFTKSGSSINPNSEAVICEIPSLLNRWHTAGSMVFDDYGDLWWSVGDNAKNEDTERGLEGSANTASLIGKILRIRPLPVAEGYTDWGISKSYTIPKGNFGEFMAAKYPSRSGEFLDRNKVYPEIYTIGNRNSYTINVDPVRRWLGYGDCGPDARTGDTEEHTLTVEPGNMGWPMFAGENVPMYWGYVPENDEEPVWEPQNPNAPINWLAPEKINGLRELPPAFPATYGYPKDCAMGGPIYRYDPALNSQVKMPPHFDRLWFIADFNDDWIDAIEMTPDGREKIDQTRLTKSDKLFDGMPFDRPLDFEVGPDGALYVLNYAGWYSTETTTHFSRVEYLGDCKPGPGEYPALEKTGCTSQGYEGYDATVPAAYHDPNKCGEPVSVKPNIQKVNLSADIKAGSELIVKVTGSGEYEIGIYSLEGKLLAPARSGVEAEEFVFSGLKHKGLCLIHITSGSEKQIHKAYLP